MCIALHAQYTHCPHTYFHKWAYCTLSTSYVPAAGRACRRYRRKTTRYVSGRARECAECAMDRKIVEDFGEAALEGLQGGGRAKKRKFWPKRGGDQVPRFETRRGSQTTVVADREAWSVADRSAVVSPGEAQSGGRRLRKRRHDSVSAHSFNTLHSEDSDGVKDRGVMGRLRTSFGSFGSFGK